MSFYTGVFIFRQELVFVHKVFLNVGLRWCPIHTVSTTLPQFEPGGSILCIFPVREDFFHRKIWPFSFFRDVSWSRFVVRNCCLTSTWPAEVIPDHNTARTEFYTRHHFIHLSSYPDASITLEHQIITTITSRHNNDKATKTFTLTFDSRQS